MNRVIKARDLDAIYIIGPGPRRAGDRRQRVPRGDVQRGLPVDHPRRGRACAQLFRQFSFPGGIPSHVAPETPGSIHEGGELGYALQPRVRRRVRQPGPRRLRGRRRRRGRDRPARHELALEQVPQPGDGRRRPADPPPQRLQDRQPDGARPDPARGADGADGGLRPHALLRRGRRPADVHQQLAATLDTVARRDPRDPAPRPRGRRHGAPALADDRAPDAEGLDGPEGRSTASRSRATGAATRCR